MLTLCLGAWYTTLDSFTLSLSPALIPLISSPSPKSLAEHEILLGVRWVGLLL